MSNNSEKVDFCLAHLKEMCEELSELDSVGILRSGFVRQLAQMYHDDGVEGSAAISCAESLVKKLAVDFVIEAYIKFGK
jgi:hypothetical protein